MSRNKDRRQTAIATFTDHTDMTEREAEVFVLRKLAAIHRSAVAEQLDISENTVDNHLANAAEKAALPNIDTVDRVGASKTGDGKGVAWDIWWPNEARVRYVWNRETEEIDEVTHRADDPQSVHNSWGVGGAEDEVAEFALTTLQEFTQDWRADLDACVFDMPDLFAAVTCYDPDKVRGIGD